MFAAHLYSLYPIIISEVCIFLSSLSTHLLSECNIPSIYGMYLRLPIFHVSSKQKLDASKNKHSLGTKNDENKK